MLAISPQFSSNFGWLLEDPISCHQQEKNYNLSIDKKTENSESSNNNLHHSPIQDHKNGGHFSNFQDESHKGFADKIVKKLNHNASERDRRKRINTMYSTLRALLPPEDQSRKLSIPATISRVLKYIPELQKEVERLNEQKKENLMSKKNMTLLQDSTIDFRKQNSRKYSKQSTLSEVIMSATRINDQEIIFQISMEKIEKGSFSEALTSLEQEGFLVLSASCFQSFEGRVFYDLHLQRQGCPIMDVAMLKEKLLSFYEKGEELRLN